MRFLRDNGLTIVLAVATIVCLAGMMLTGVVVYNDELSNHGENTVTIGQYVVSGHFLSALFENWESEFLQMSAYVVLTAFLFQRGSAESKNPDEPVPQDNDPTAAELAKAPLAVRMGGVSKTLYSYSLGIVLFLLFVVSFVFHLRDSAVAQAEDALLHGLAAPTVMDHLLSAEFWFESFQNWQSEFLSTAVVVVLSIFLRFRGSPESKPVGAPHSETGS